MGGTALAPVAAILACLALPAAGGEPSPGTEILNTGSYWRHFIAWKTEQVRTASGELEVLDAKTGGVAEVVSSPLPPADWAAPEFDDGSWARVRGPVPAGSGEMSLLCLRGRFEVKDPAAAGKLRLTLEVLGGVIVYLNGAEIARQGMPEGRPDLSAPAADYPEEAYLDPEGFLYRNSWGDPEKYRDRLRSRVREVRNLVVPAAALRKGTNVLALEIHRAPASKLLLTKKTRDAAREAWRGRAHYWWSRLGFRTLRLTSGGTGASANVARPTGLQVWNHPICQRVEVVDYGDPNEPLRPVELSGARNSVVSGQVVVGSTAAIRGLRVTAGDMKATGGDGVIPAAATEVRFLLPDGPKGRSRPACFETLVPEAPAEVPVAKAGGGAVQPVWIRVRVPEDAPAGSHSGKLRISADGTAAVEVPVSLKVHDWVMPDPREFASHVGLVQSPETVAAMYKAELWSERHWQLMDRSFRLMGQVGSDCVFIPLIRRTHFGNEHSMVRWIRKEGNGYSHHFGLAEKYLDLALKHLGEPEVICLYCWEPFTGSNYFGKPGKTSMGMPFTILDPATGKLEEAEGPKWGTPEIRGFWKPVIDGMRELLAARGLEKSMMVGTAGDSRPNKDAVEDLKAVAPDTPWVLHSHGYAESLSGSRVGHMCDVWNSPVAPDPAKKRLYGWQNPFIRATFPRPGSRTVESIRIGSPPAQYLVSLEGMQAAGIRGFGRVGADFWDIVPEGSRSRRGHNLLGRYPESGWAQLNLENSAAYVLSPGPDGALPTVRFEMIRAAAQQVEARIFLEKLLLDTASRNKLGEDLAGRIQKLLDERTRAVLYARRKGWLWFLSSGWQARDDALFAAAAEAAAAIKKAG
jgi:hypothetical protein